MKMNVDVRERASRSGVYLWQIAAAIGVSEPTFIRKMRVELPESEKKRIFKVIEDIETERKGGIVT